MTRKPKNPQTIIKNGVMIMAWIEADKKKDSREENNFLRMLDRGIDDMEAGRELPLEDAFQKISELRTIRRNARV